MRQAVCPCLREGCERVGRHPDCIKDDVLDNQLSSQHVHGNGITMQRALQGKT
jgi:hypothetical protein